MENLVDIHCHILPGIDDGSPSLQVSMEMVRQAVKQGVGTIVATPHFIIGESEHDFAFIQGQVENLQTEIDKAGLACKILTGAEIYICPELIDRIKEKTLITLNQTSYVLIEFPSFEFNENLLEIVRHLVLNGYKPVIAHPERNKVFLKNPEMVEKLVLDGSMLQVNGSSILGRNGSMSQKFVIELTKKGLVHFIASDAHSATNRKIILKEPLEMLDKLVREDVSSYLSMNSRNAVRNSQIEQIDINALQKSRGVLGRLRKVFSK